MKASLLSQGILTIGIELLVQPLNKKENGEYPWEIQSLYTLKLVIGNSVMLLSEQKVIGCGGMKASITALIGTVI